MECQTICRICLCLIGETEFDSIEETITHFLDMLLLKLKMDDHIEPIVCNVCAKSLKEAFDFKMACLNVEHKLLEFINSKEDVKVDLKELYLKAEPNIIEANEIVENQRICRFCLSLKAVDCCTSLNESKKNMSILDTIQNHIPELNLSITEELIICDTCLDSLQNFHKFMKACLGGLRASQNKKFGDTNEIKTGILCSPVIEKENNGNGLYEMNKKELNISMESDIKFEDAMERENFSSIIKNEANVDNVGQDCSRCFSIESLKPQSNPSDPKQCSHNSSGIIYTCDWCMYTSECYFNKHLLSHKQPLEVTTYKCNVCPFKTNNRHDLITHLLVHKDPSNISKCDIYPIHKTKQKYPLEISMYKCYLCTYETKDKRNLKYHMLSHKTNKEITLYKCSHCTYRCTYKSRLKEHQLMHKNTSEVYMFQCDFCTYKNRYKHNIKNHLKNHKINPDMKEGMKLYKCDLCTYKTWHKQSLTLHYKKHKDPLEVKWFKCELCSYRTRYRNNLVPHALKHKKPSDVTMYKCEVCSFESKYKTSLSNHRQIHKKHNTDLVGSIRNKLFKIMGIKNY